MPDMKQVQIDRLNASLTNQSPTQEQIARIETLRCIAKIFGEAIIRESATSREQSFAITNLDECLMWAVKGIILNPGV